MAPAVRHQRAEPERQQPEDGQVQGGPQDRPQCPGSAGVHVDAGAGEDRLAEEERRERCGEPGEERGPGEGGCLGGQHGDPLRRATSVERMEPVAYSPVIVSTPSGRPLPMAWAGLTPWSGPHAGLGGTAERSGEVIRALAGRLPVRGVGRR
ncbi:MAG TPA: hypothetical protein VGI31_11115, partial [Streptosporangiaceae bacterium]